MEEEGEGKMPEVLGNLQDHMKIVVTWGKV